MIRLVTLTNFQAFHSEVRFPLEKLNLIFGPNGAGKTSLFRALQLLGMNSDSLLSGQIKFVNHQYDFKNFRNLVFNHDQSNVMKIGVYFDADELFDGQHLGKRFSILAETIDASDPMVEVEAPLDRLNIRYFYVSVEISVDGSLDKIAIGAFRNLPNETAGQSVEGCAVSLVKLEHHWGLEANSDSLHFVTRYGELLEFVNGPKGSFEDTPWYGGRNLDKFEPIEDWLLNAFVGNIDLQQERFHSRLKTLTLVSRTGHDLSASRFLGLGVSFINYVLDEFNLELSRFRALPPLRHLPKPIEYEILDGAQPIDVIDYDPIQKSAKSELISKLLFDFTERYKFIEHHSISASGSDVIERLLLDDFTKSKVRFEDVGVGVSQVLPILIAVYEKWGKVLAIEQPEIHLHPKLQSKLMDLFIELVNGFGWPQTKVNHDVRLNSLDSLNQLITEIELPSLPSKQPKQWSGKLNFPRAYPAYQVILETHSENLILRLQRRLSEGSIGIDSVSVMYVDSADTKQVKALKPSEDFDFLSSWPKSFVDFRIEEIFCANSFIEKDDF